MKVGDKVIITRLNGIPMREEVVVVDIVNFGFTCFYFSPLIKSYSYFSENCGDTYEEIKDKERVFKIGDRVRISKIADPEIAWNCDGDMDYLDGKVVVIEEIYSDKIRVDSWNISFDCLEKVEERKFKVGDRLKQVKPGNAPHLIGQVIEITSQDREDHFYAGTAGFTTGYLEENFELVESDGPRLKVGDRVKILSKNYSDGIWGGLEQSVVYKEGKGYGYVNRIDEDKIVVGSERNNTGDYFLESDLELVEELSDYEKATIAQNSYQEDCEEVEEQEDCPVKDPYKVTYTTSEPTYLGNGLADMLREYQWPTISVPSDLPRANKLFKDKKMNIIKFVKDKALSKEEKVLRRVGFKDEEGNWTTTGIEAVLELEAKALGFKNFEVMSEMYTNKYLDAFKLHELFTKYKDELVKIAFAYEKENK